MFVSCTVSVLSGRGLCDGPIPLPVESYRMWCVSECDQVKINNLDTCCEQVGRRGKDCDTVRNLKMLEMNSCRKCLFTPEKQVAVPRDSFSTFQNASCLC
jgi:hypothetical protein